ncbi:hypothetical protein WR25_01071 [Diploscapter pachys]|uniref:Uncharacterized protein n=1 Tax=Diploscapter pachys TaxID=2018661 RepID=A0A2A2JT58_9BILA|nr:hypothetical protein WR25_01071 [Diploscapter pachys]
MEAVSGETRWAWWTIFWICCYAVRVLFVDGIPDSLQRESDGHSPHRLPRECHQGRQKCRRMDQDRSSQCGCSLQYAYSPGDKMRKDIENSLQIPPHFNRRFFYNDMYKIVDGFVFKRRHLPYVERAPPSPRLLPPHRTVAEKLGGTESRYPECEPKGWRGPCPSQDSPISSRSASPGPYVDAYFKTAIPIPEDVERDEWLKGPPAGDTPQRPSSSRRLRDVFFLLVEPRSSMNAVSTGLSAPPQVGMPRKAARGGRRATGSGALKLTQEPVKNDEGVGKDEEQLLKRRTSTRQKSEAVKDIQKAAPRATRKRPAISYAESDEEEPPVPKRRGRPPKSTGNTKISSKTKDEKGSVASSASNEAGANSPTAKTGRRGGRAPSKKMSGAADHPQASVSTKATHNDKDTFDRDSLKSASASENYKQCVSLMRMYRSDSTQIDACWSDAVPEDVQLKLAMNKPSSDASKSSLKTPDVELDNLGRKLQLHFTLFGADVKLYRDKYATKTYRRTEGYIKSKLFGQMKADNSSYQAGHVIAECLGGSGKVENVFLQNPEVNHGMSRFEQRLVAILSSTPSSRFDSFWRFEYSTGNTENAPARVSIYTKLTIDDSYSGQLNFRFENRQGIFSTIPNQMQQPISSLHRDFEEKFAALPSYTIKKNTTFDLFVKELQEKYRNFSGIPEIHNSNGSVEPEIFTDDQQRRQLSAASFVIEKTRPSNLFVQNSEINRQFGPDFEIKLCNSLVKKLLESKNDGHTVRVDFLAE